MTTIFGHHAHGFVEIGILGRPFPDGPTEHVLSFAVTAITVVLMLYGGYSLARDLIRRRIRSSEQARK